MQKKVWKLIEGTTYNKKARWIENLKDTYKNMNEDIPTEEVIDTFYNLEYLLSIVKIFSENIGTKFDLDKCEKTPFR